MYVFVLPRYSGKASYCKRDLQVLEVPIICSKIAHGLRSGLSWKVHEVLANEKKLKVCQIKSKEIAIHFVPV
jgi:hypothetical protein